MISEIFNSELKVYYLALVIAGVAALMGIIFLAFKSVATLMMTISALFIIIAAIIILAAAIYLDYTEGKFKPSYHHNSRH